MTHRLAGAPLDQHPRGRILRSGGHALLVAHHPKWYDRLAHAWMEDATMLLRVPEHGSLVGAKGKCKENATARNISYS